MLKKRNKCENVKHDYVLSLRFLRSLGGKMLVWFSILFKTIQITKKIYDDWRTCFILIL